MHQPSVYSRAKIIDAAFELLRSDGWDAVSTRAIARKLGSSTMPIYSHVRSVDELERELRGRARRLMRKYQRRDYTEEALLNAAFGYIAFARDERHLFRFLYLDRPDGLGGETGGSMIEVFRSEFGEDSPAARALAELEGSGQEVLIRYTWIFTHGLATLVNAGAIGSATDDDILRLLRGAGEAFYLWGVGGNREDG